VRLERRFGREPLNHLAALQFGSRRLPKAFHGAAALSDTLELADQKAEALGKEYHAG